MVLKEHRFRVFENKILRRIFGPKGEEVVGGWWKLHSEGLHNLHSSPGVTRMIKWILYVHVAHIGEIKNEYKT